MKDYIILSNGVKIPKIGFGVFRTADGQECCDAVKNAIDAGYRHIDTAYSYGNETGVGEGIKASGIAREEIFVTTKAWNKHIRAGFTKEFFMESLQKLGLDYVDLYLIHWPVEGKSDAWKVFEELYEMGKIRAIGVSNFHKNHLDELMQTAKIKPMVNQIESNPVFNNQELIDYCQSEGIAVEAWSPLGGNGASILSNEALIKIADKHKKSPAQVIIRWNYQRDVVVLPKSATKSRIFDNYNIFDFELDENDMKEIFDINENKRSGADPDNFNF
ncbi:MAG: aldo/keto reductase [Clostridia bacterium]